MNFRRVVLRPRRGFLSTPVLAITCAVVMGPVAASGQQACGSSATVSPASRVWPTPLDRVISLRVRNVSLREGLDRIAVTSRLRISYSADLLPLDRRVCLSADSISAGDALIELLAGTNVEPVSTGSDHVVLAPQRETSKPQEMAGSVQTLERVVVTGSATGDAQRSLSVALDVLDGKRLAGQSSSTFASSFDGSIPGLWVWEQSPSSLLARYGSIRGASSFGVSYPKVYIDGIEVANPLLVTELNPAVLDRVEVIRGPQGAALYGADAISGVVNIVTRHDGTQAGMDRTEVSSGAGVSQTQYAARSVFAQNHALTWRGGSSMRSGSVAMSVATLGGYVPEAYSRDFKLNAGIRTVTSKASFTGTARFYGKEAAVGENPLLRGFAQPAAVASRELQSTAIITKPPRSSVDTVAAGAATAQDTLPESVHEYTFGGTTTFFTAGRWTPSLVAGIDGYRLANVPNDLAAVSSAIDTALHAARGGADRGTVRGNLVGQFDLAPRNTLTVTLAAEHSALRETQPGTTIVDTSGRAVAGQRPASDVVAWRSNSGLIAQGNLGINEALYVTGGLRLERNDGFTVRTQVALLPMLGVAAVRDIGAATLKLRGAYGRGIRPVQTPTRAMALRDIHWRSGTPSLDPEEQSGTEVGADLLFGRRLGLHLTRFDQTASGLIQPVAIAKDSSGAMNQGSGKPGLVYVLQNVGEITNRGWEMESSLSFGPLGIGGALSLVDSKVQRIARGYTGDMRVGDRMLGVPGQTASVSASWTRPHWYTTVTTSRASDWVNYDRLKLAKDFQLGTATAQDMSGNRLRSYWRRYDGVTRIRATLSRDLLSNVALKLTGDNLTNVQRGEPDNITVLPGRTLLIGLSAKIR